MGVVVLNEGVMDRIDGPEPGRQPMAFHRSLPGYSVTGLQSLPDLAARLGVGEILVKDESDRMDLPAYKILGASWATYRAILRHLGVAHPQSLAELMTMTRARGGCVLVTASEGNHGRAVARMAGLLEVAARVFLPRDVASARRVAIESEGAEVVIVDGGYDEAVAAAARDNGAGRLVIQDQSWEGYEEVPQWIIDGYATMLWEIEDQLADRGERGPDLVLVQIGVGSLASAVVRHYRRPGLSSPPRVVGVEPSAAACALAAFEAGRIVEVPGPHESIMAGLNCGVVGTLAWPLLRDGVDAFVAVENERCRESVRLLGEAGLAIGASGAAGLAGLLELLCGEEVPRHYLGLHGETRVLVLATEGETG